MPAADNSSSSDSFSQATLKGKELSKLFNVIDRLRECGVSEDISLPQLVVVGDQSSGKSSVLEALTGIPFPVAGTLCTRFATQISFRRTREESITVSIIPAKDADEDRSQLLREYTKSLKTLDAAEFSSIIQEVSAQMGLPKPGEELAVSDTPRFTNDVLKIELSGPDRPHFALIDTPGLFSSATSYQTDEDAVVVENLVKGYIKDNRTIILAVASSLHEVANQKVFRLSKEADPKGVRTVGLLTKADALQPGAENPVMDVALNKVTILTHGWFLVRNRAPKEVADGVTLAQRKKNERVFFTTEPWKALDRDRVGIEALERFLRRLVAEHLKKEFPALVRELSDLFAECKASLADLGPSRETAEEQRMLLIELANNCQSIARSAIFGHYSVWSLNNDKLKLRMVFQNANEDFAHAIRRKGHLHDFDATGDIETQPEILDWIEDIRDTSRGAELPGMPNPLVLQTLLRLQTEKWGDIAKQHLFTIKRRVDDFNRELLRAKCTDDDLRSAIWARLSPRYAHSFEQAQKELAKILADERGEVLITYDNGYVSELDKLKEKRLEMAIKHMPGSDPNGYISKDKILDQLCNTRNDEELVSIYDFLKAYYKIARRRFIDTVCLHVVERHFISANDGPIRLFSPEFAGSLSPEDLQAICGEDFSIVSQRKVLKAKLERLENAQNIASGGYI